MADASPGTAPKVTRVGDYEVLVGGSAVAFWPLDPEVDLAKSRPPIHVAPMSGSGVNTVVTPIFGVFDILIRATTGLVTNQIAAPGLAAAPGGKATLKKAAMVGRSDGTIRIRFATDHTKVAAGGSWEGSLRLTGKAKIGTSAAEACKIEIKLKVIRSGTVSDLFVFFVAHARPKKNAWITSRVESTTGTAITRADIDLKVLREQGAFKNVNRRVTVDADGGDLIGAKGRPVLAVPVNWPLIFTVTKSPYVKRAHMINVKEAEATRDNLSPLDVGPITLTDATKAKLTGKKFLFDAGHGVAYANTKARRSQEWYVAHRLADRIAAILVANHKVNAHDITWCRSAGFGLIDPARVHNGSPEQGDAKYNLDLPGKKVAIKQTSAGLHEIAALLLTKHADGTDAAVPLTVAEYDAFLVQHRTTINAVVTRLNTKLSATHERVEVGSVHYDEKTKHYVHRKEKLDKAGVWQAVTTAPPVLAITAADWFSLDANAFKILADRTARWSLFSEIGGNPTFKAAARKAMLAEGALAYFREKVLFYVNVTAPHPYLSSGPKAWGPSDRNRFLSSAGADADLLVTLHENAGAGLGGMVLVSNRPGADKPPADQVRIAKIFTKYLDPFDHGVQGGGVVKALVSNPVEMLYHGNAVREKYAYFETEFMDAKDPLDPAKFTYETMVTPAFIDRVAQQIVCGIVEWLLDPQANFDPVKYPLGANIENLW